MTTEGLRGTAEVDGDPEGRAPPWTAWAVALGILAVGFRVLGNVTGVDIDLFHEMALFREALELGRIPREDSFAFTPTVYPVVHHEWGTGAILYLVTVGLGLGAEGLQLLRVLLLGGIVACCLQVARSRGARPGAMALLAPLGIILFWPGLSPVRAHLFSFFFLALLLVMLEKERAGNPRWLLLWPLLFVIWINLHGGFVVGLGLLGVYAAERMVRAGWRTGRDGDGAPDPGRGGAPALGEAVPAAVRDARLLLVAIGISFPLLLVNPYGWDYIPFLWEALTQDRPYITEWQPLWSPTFRGGPLFLFLLSFLVFGYTVWRSGDWRRVPGILLVLVTAFAAVRSVRLLPFYVVVWFPLVAAALSTTPFLLGVERVWRKYARPLAACIALLGGALIAQVVMEGGHRVTLPVENGDRRHLYPAGAVDYLEEVGFEGNLMTPFPSGAYVSWRLHPRVRVGLDSRYEVAYPTEFAEEAMRIYDGRGDWAGFLERYGADAVLARNQSPLDSMMVEGITWIEVYRDDQYGIYARDEVARTLPITNQRGQRIQVRFP